MSTDTGIQGSSIYICEAINTHTHTKKKLTKKNKNTGTQQEEEEVLAKEVGDEWALSKQHLEQEVPIGSFARRKEVCLVCV